MIMPAEFTTADEVRQHAAEVQRRLATYYKPERKVMPDRPAVVTAPDDATNGKEVMPDTGRDIPITTATPAEDNGQPPSSAGDMLHAPRWTVLMWIVCRHFGVRRYQIMSTIRIWKISRARQVLMYLMHEDLCMSFPTIGRLLHRDHTTALHGHRNVPLLCARDPAFAGRVEMARRELWDRLRQKAERTAGHD